MMQFSKLNTMQPTISQIYTVNIILYNISLLKWMIYVQIELKGVKFNTFIGIFCSFQKEKAPIAKCIEKKRSFLLT